jgi:hypothetical protein
MIGAFDNTLKCVKWRVLLGSVYNMLNFNRRDN